MRALVLILAATPALADPVIPRFVQETDTGLVHQFTGDWEQMVGGGVAVFDCNGDALPELALAGGTSKAALFLNQSEPSGLHFLAADNSGVELDQVSGLYPLDIDSDGIMDLVALRTGPDLVLKGEGNCRFRQAGDLWSFDGQNLWSTAFAATWEAGQTFPTLAIGTYIDRTEEDFPWGSCTENWLYRPSGDRYGPPLALTPSYCALSILFTDWNGSGVKSLRVSNDREYYKGGQEQMWSLPAGAAPVLLGPKDGWKPLKIWGMGIATTDLGADGFPEFFLTSMADNKFQVLKDPASGQPVYADEAFPRHMIAQRPYTGGDVRPSTAWHAQFEDVNNDGLADLFIAKGNVSEMPDFAMQDPNNLLLQQADGTFAEVGDKAGIASMLTARGAMVADLNADGALDLVVVNRNGPAEVWRNDSADLGHFLSIRLRQDGANRDAIGAFIEVQTGQGLQRREIFVGGGHASGQNGDWHFGLGESTTAKVRVIWPDGSAGAWQEVDADQRLVLTKPATP